MRGATKTRSRRREWLEPFALEPDAEDLVAVRVHERGGQEPVGPVDRDPALDALVGGDGSGVGDEPRRGAADGRGRERGLGLPSVDSTAKPSRGAFGGRRSTDRRLTAALRSSGHLCADIAPECTFL